MPTSDSEKLIINLLLDIHEQLKIKSVDTDFVRSSIQYGDMWALKNKYTGIFSDSDERDAGDVNFVHDALTMWRVLEEHYDNLSDADKEAVKASRGAFGSAPRFEGFDGHTDLVSIARIMIEKLDMYDEFAGRELDAHQRNRDVHERMVEAYRDLPDRLGYLTADQIIAVLDARIHPENR